MNDLVTQPGTQMAVPSYLQQQVQNVDNKELSGGLTSALTRISFRAGSFRIMDGGAETHIMDPAVDAAGNPVPGTMVAREIGVVIVKGNPELSKTYYKDKYKEGSKESPDCTSGNGLTPDSHVQTKQAESCMTCPNNQWGSAYNESGKATKACSDQKRIAVKLMQPGKTLAESPIFLLTIPPASLSLFNAYITQELGARQLPAAYVRTIIGFDPNASYPKLTFRFGDFIAEGDVQTIKDTLEQVAELERIVGISDVADTRALVAPVEQAVLPAHIPVQQPVVQPVQTAVQPVQVVQPMASPEVIQPQIVQPQVVQQVAQPEVIQPVQVVQPIIQPQVVQPEVIQPQVVQPTQQQIQAAVLVDSAGVAHDPAIHAKSKTFKADGTWKSATAKNIAKAAAISAGAPQPVQQAVVPNIPPVQVPVQQVVAPVPASAPAPVAAETTDSLGGQLDAMLQNINNGQ